MTFDFTGTRIFIKPGATDLRKAAAGLSYQVRDEIKMKPLGGDVFLFCNRSRKLINVKSGLFFPQGERI
jgi:transposase